MSRTKARGPTTDAVSRAPVKTPSVDGIADHVDAVVTSLAHSTQLIPAELIGSQPKGPTCRRCGAKMTHAESRVGRRSIFCSAACRQSAYRDRRWRADGPGAPRISPADAPKRTDRVLIPAPLRNAGPVEIVGRCFRWPRSRTIALDQVLRRAILITELSPTEEASEYGSATTSRHE
jgi:hypothetical protein